MSSVKEPAIAIGSLSQDSASSQETVDAVRAERDDYRLKLERIAEAIGCDDMDKIVHDVRNVLNERSLLRKLVELDEE